METRIPFQVMLDREQHHRLRRVATRRGESVGSIIRESVARYLADISVEDDPLFGFIGLVNDLAPRPHGDVASEHDAYLADMDSRGGTDTVGHPAGSPVKKGRRSPRRSTTSA